MKPYKLSKDELYKVRFPCYVQPKFDGWRIVILNGRALTYKLKPIPNNHIRTELEKIFKGIRYYLIDGEGLLADEKATYQDIQSAYSTVEGKPDFRLVLFDCIRADGYMYNYQTRLIHLELIRDHISDWPDRAYRHNNIELIHYYHFQANDNIDLTEQTEHWIEQEYEGAIYRQKHGEYKFGRSTLNDQYLLAYKPTIDAEARIIGFTVQETNMNEAELDEHGHTKRSHSKAGKVKTNLLGSFKVEGINGRFKGVKFEIGTGFTELRRKKFYLEWENNLNKIIKYSYQDIGSKDKPRMPVFKGFRSEEDL